MMNNSDKLLFQNLVSIIKNEEADTSIIKVRPSFEQMLVKGRGREPFAFRFQNFDHNLKLSKCEHIVFLKNEFT